MLADNLIMQRASTDHALEAADQIVEHQQLLTNLGMANQGSEYPFPVKLHYMLDDVAKKGFDDIVAWLPDGDGFIIRKPKEAAKHILQVWFRQKCYGSFQRQLNLYNFTRIKSGSKKGAYFHELFLRGQPGLAYGIKRVPIKSAKGNNQNCLRDSTKVVVSSQNIKANDAVSNAQEGLSISSQEEIKYLEYSSVAPIGNSPQLWSSAKTTEHRSALNVMQEGGAVVNGSNTFFVSPMAIPDFINSDMLIDKKSGLSPAGSTLVSTRRSMHKRRGNLDAVGMKCIANSPVNKKGNAIMMTSLAGGAQRPYCSPETIAMETGTKETLTSASASTTIPVLSFPKLPGCPSSLDAEDFQEAHTTLPCSTLVQQRRRSSNYCNHAQRSQNFHFLNDLMNEGAEDGFFGTCQQQHQLNKHIDGNFSGQSSSSREKPWTMVHPALEPEIKAQFENFCVRRRFEEESITALSQ